MIRFVSLAIVASLSLSFAYIPWKVVRDSGMLPETVNDPSVCEPLRQGDRGAAVLRLQILLDRANFSPGELGAVYNRNTANAVAAYQIARGLPGSGIVDRATWAELNRDAERPLIRYRIEIEDVEGPFERVPEDMIQKSLLPAMTYESPLEGLGEKFHVSPELLQRLNPGAQFDMPGEEIIVPNVRVAPPGEAASLIVDGGMLTLRALDAEGKMIASYPVSVGGRHDPLPVGQWQVTSVVKKPSFRYDPSLFWDSEPWHWRVKIAPGPNNPVGLVWIGISKRHYGIHGTPEPGEVGEAESRGCIRVTNWDALEIAGMVKPGTPVILVK